MKYQVLSSLKNNEKLFKTVVCCSRDWRLKGKPYYWKSYGILVPQLTENVTTTVAFGCM